MSERQSFDFHAQALIDEYNQAVTDYNTVCDLNETLVNKLESLQEEYDRLRKLFDKQTTVIAAAVEVKKRDTTELQQLRASNRELQALDPKRLQKINAEQKKRIAELKTSLDASEAGRKKAISDVNRIAKRAAEENGLPFYTDNETGNALRFVPNAFLNPDNDFNGVPHTPVLEFFHQKRGITRQGVILNTGHIAWCDARNSSPTAAETSIALSKLQDYCVANKIKLPKVSEAA